MMTSDGKSLPGIFTAEDAPESLYQGTTEGRTFNFYVRETALELLGGSPVNAVLRSPFLVPRSSFPVPRSPFPVPRSLNSLC